MKYWRIIDGPGGVKQRWFLGDPETATGIKLDARLFTEGNKWIGQKEYPIVPNAELLQAERDYGHKKPIRIPIFRGHSALSFTLGAFELPVAQERIAEHLEACCNRDIQLIPAVIPGNNEKYEIVNVLKVLDAVDETYSEIQWRTKPGALESKIKPYAGISRLVLKAEVIGASPIFRVKNWRIALVVSDHVKVLLEGLKTTGITFKEVTVRASVSPHY